MFTEKLTLDEREIVPPYDFTYQLDHYVLYPETRVGDALVEVIRLGSGGIVKVEVRSLGTVEHPALELTVQSAWQLSKAEVREATNRVAWFLGLHEDLRPFYELVKDDPVMQAAIAMHYGAKDKAGYSVFEALVGCVCAQNVIFKRLYAMLRNLCQRFGDSVVLDGVACHVFPTPEQLAAAPVEDMRACKVGYRDKYIKGIAEAVASGQVNLEHIVALPLEEARRELIKLPGVGPYTADLALILALRRRDILHLDLFVRQALWTFYFDGRQVPDGELRAFAAQRWPGYQAWAAGLLTTNTEVWARKLGVDFRLRSGARG